MDLKEYVFRLLVALAGGLLIGFERELHHKSAGLRTNALVAIGSALYVMLSIEMTQNGGDVTRIIAQVVSGIGFLGAGIIFKEGLNVHGLTTAATIWCSSAIGCMAASGYYLEAIIGTAFILIVNNILLPLERKLLKSDKEKDL